MANVKITELSSATTLGSTDVFPVVDVGSTQTRKVTVADLLRNTPDGTAGAPSIANAGDQDTGIYTFLQRITLVCQRAARSGL